MSVLREQLLALPIDPDYNPKNALDIITTNGILRAWRESNYLWYIKGSALITANEPSLLMILNEYTITSLKRGDVVIPYTNA